MCVRVLHGTESVTKDAPVQQESHVGTTTRPKKVKKKYLKMYEQIVKEETNKLEKPPEEHPIDAVLAPEIAAHILTDSTVRYKNFLQKIANCYETFQRSKMYKIVFHTTQPAHIITITAVLCVISALMPASDKVRAEYLRSRMMSFIYLTSFVIHFGAQIWMTFVSGLSLYFALPRHTFGEVQRVLFPRYFTLNACLSLTTLLIFLKHHPIQTWTIEIAVQVLGMSGAFFIELLTRVYLTPTLIHLIVQKTTLERAAGVGNEVGHHDLGLLKHCPHYLKIHSAFRRAHAAIAIGNILSMACTVLHLYYLASKLCVL